MTIDLDDVESRIKHTSENDYAWLLGTRSGAALFAEVERLRLDLADIEHAYKFACDKAKLLERQAVLAFLRETPYWPEGSASLETVLDDLAERIERGEHLKENEK
jgi:hypothetical protein